MNGDNIKKLHEAAEEYIEYAEFRCNDSLWEYRDKRYGEPWALLEYKGGMYHLTRPVEHNAPHTEVINDENSAVVRFLKYLKIDYFFEVKHKKQGG